MFSGKVSLHQNQLIPLTIGNPFIRVCNQKGLNKVEDCFEAGKFITFERMKDKFSVSNNTVFCYNQVRAFLVYKLGGDLILAKISQLELLERKEYENKFISNVYNFLRIDSHIFPIIDINLMGL